MEKRQKMGRCKIKQKQGRNQPSVVKFGERNKKTCKKVNLGLICGTECDSIT